MKTICEDLEAGAVLRRGRSQTCPYHCIGSTSDAPQTSGLEMPWLPAAVRALLWEGVGLPYDHCETAHTRPSCGLDAWHPTVRIRLNSGVVAY